MLAPPASCHTFRSNSFPNSIEHIELILSTRLCLQVLRKEP